MKIAKILSIAYLTLAPLAALNGESAWKEGFEQGIGSAQPYDPTNAATAIESGNQDPAEGETYLRAVFKGGRSAGFDGGKSLEGVQLSVPGLPGDRLIKVTAKVRGEDRLLLAIFSKNGWVYGPENTLSGQWQTIELKKALSPADTDIQINFLSLNSQAGFHVDIDDIQVEIEDPLTTTDDSVTPQLFEAEYYGQGATAEPSASGQKVISFPSPFTLDNIPFPQTGQPISVYVRVRAETPDATIGLQSWRPGVAQQIRTTTIDSPSSEWQWVEFAGLSVEEFGESLSVIISPDSKNLSAIACDAVVISTQPGIDSVELEKNLQ